MDEKRFLQLRTVHSAPELCDHCRRRCHHARDLRQHRCRDRRADPRPPLYAHFASAAYSADKRLLGTFSANLELLPGATGHPETMHWWAGQSEAWAACRESPQPPEQAMPAYVAWLKSLPGRPVFVAYPAGFDFLFVYWYLIRFAGESPFSHSALDIKTYAMAMLKSEYRAAVKRAMPRRWFDPHRHTHVAMDDAIEQGALFCNMLAEHTRSQEERP